MPCALVVDKNSMSNQGNFTKMDLLDSCAPPLDQNSTKLSQVNNVMPKRWALLHLAKIVVHNLQHVMRKLLSYSAPPPSENIVKQNPNLTPTINL